MTARRRNPMEVAVGRSVSMPLLIWEQIDDQAEQEETSRSELLIRAWKAYQGGHRGNGNAPTTLTPVPEVDPEETGF